MSQTIRVPDKVYEAADEIQQTYEYPTIGEAVRHVFREADHDV